MSGFPKKNFISIAVSLLVLICFAAIPFSQAHAAKAPAKAPAKAAAKAPAKAAAKAPAEASDKKAAAKAQGNSTATKTDEAASKSKDDDILLDDDKKPDQAQTQEAPKDLVTQILDYSTKNPLIVGGGAAVLVLIVVLLIVLGGGKKSTCTKCGKKIRNGETLCEICKNSEMLLGMEGNEGPVQPGAAQQPSFESQYGSQIAPQQPQQPSFGSQTAPQQPQQPAPAAAPPAAAEAKKKARPTGRVIATITIRKGANAGHRYSFFESQTQISIGRDPECDIVLDDEEDKDIATRHAVISMAEGSQFTVHDMSTATGIMVNNEFVKQSPLKSGDVIKISKTELTFARL